MTGLSGPGGEDIVDSMLGKVEQLKVRAVLCMLCMLCTLCMLSFLFQLPHPATRASLPWLNERSAWWRR